MLFKRLVCVRFSMEAKALKMLFVGSFFSCKMESLHDD